MIVLDQRSRRRQDRTATLTKTGLAEFNAWVDRLVGEGRFGAVVTGQSLLDEPVSATKGNTADWVLSDYGDYEAVVRVLAPASTRSFARPRPWSTPLASINSRASAPARRSSSEASRAGRATPTDLA